MSPDGPYTSPYTSKPFFIVSTIRNGQIVYAIVANGENTSDATMISDNVRDARKWMKDNGFTRQER